MKYSTIADVTEGLTELRGRSKARVLDESDALRALVEALRSGSGWIAGQTVANCYAYPAYRMRIGTLRYRGDGLWIGADWGSARRGSSPVPGGGPREHFEHRADTTLSACRAVAVGKSWIVRRSEVVRLLAAQSRIVRRTAATAWPESGAPESVLVTKRDSVVAGNCPRETDRVAGWFGGRTAVSARELRAAILRRDPTLARYGRRAVDAALAAAQSTCPID